MAQMETMRSSIVNRKNLVLNVTADQNLMNSFTPSLEGLVSKLPAAESKLFLWEGTLDVRNEAIIIPTQVNYVAQVLGCRRGIGKGCRRDGGCVWRRL